MLILALEASTSAAKAMIYDAARGEVLDTLAAEYGPAICDTVTIEPDGAVAAVLECGRRLLDKNPGMTPEIIGLSSIWHSLLPLDGEGRPLGRVLTWADTSAAPTVAKYKADRELCRRLYSATGCAQHSSYNLWKWMHLRETGDTGSVASLSSMCEYLYTSLTGKRQFSRSAAAGSGFMSARELDWNDEVLAFAGISREMLSELCEPWSTSALLARPARALGLPAGTPVTVTNPDGALNHIAAGGLGGGVMTLSVGTSGALRMAAPEPVLPAEPANWSYYGGEGMWISGAATSGAGNCVKWLCKEVFAGAYSYAALDELASKTPPEDAPYFLPFLFGERCPGWDDARRGGFCALKPGHGPGSMQYAVLEGVLANLYQNYMMLKKVAGEPETVSISGGITVSPFWLGLAADMFGLPLCENTGEHASLLGAARVAERAAEGLKSLKDISLAKGKRHEPRKDRRPLLARRMENWLTYYAKGV